MGREGKEDRRRAGWGREKRRERRRERWEMRERDKRQNGMLVTWNVRAQGIMRWVWSWQDQSQVHSPNSAERGRSVHLKRLGW